MKKLLLAATVALSAAMPAQAEQASCQQIGELARMVMEKRQEGVSMSVLMGIAKDNKLIRVMVVEAFKRPDFSSDEYKKREQIKFRNAFESLCYQTQN